MEYGATYGNGLQFTLLVMHKFANQIARKDENHAKGPMVIMTPVSHLNFG